jgi:hypothetical protein
MPHVTLTLTPEGLALPVVIGLSGKDSAALASAGQPVPTPVRLRGAIDTATNITVVSAAVLSQFGLVHVRDDSTWGVGGFLSVRLYEVSLSIPRMGALQQALLVLDHLVVMGWDSPPADIDVLVGLDVLEHLWTLYDGPRKEFTLGD